MRVVWQFKAWSNNPKQDPQDFPKSFKGKLVKLNKSTTYQFNMRNFGARQEIEFLLYDCRSQAQWKNLYSL